MRTIPPQSRFNYFYMMLLLVLSMLQRGAQGMVSSYGYDTNNGVSDPLKLLLRDPNVADIPHFGMFHHMQPHRNAIGQPQQVDIQTTHLPLSMTVSATETSPKIPVGKLKKSDRKKIYDDQNSSVMPLTDAALLKHYFFEQFTACVFLKIPKACKQAGELIEDTSSLTAHYNRKGLDLKVSTIDGSRDRAAYARGLFFKREQALLKEEIADDVKRAGSRKEL